jgi:hypothetical protein
MCAWREKETAVCRGELRELSGFPSSTLVLLENYSHSTPPNQYSNTFKTPFSHAFAVFRLHYLFVFVSMILVTPNPNTYLSLSIYKHRETYRQLSSTPPPIYTPFLLSPLPNPSLHHSVQLSHPLLLSLLHHVSSTHPQLLMTFSLSSCVVHLHFYIFLIF